MWELSSRSRNGSDEGDLAWLTSLFRIRNLPEPYVALTILKPLFSRLLSHCGEKTSASSSVSAINRLYPPKGETLMRVVKAIRFRVGSYSSSPSALFSSPSSPIGQLFFSWGHLLPSCYQCVRTRCPGRGLEVVTGRR